MDQLQRHGLRIVLLILALALACLTAFFPVTEEARIDLHDGEEGILLTEGSSLTVPIAAGKSLAGAAVRLKGVKEAKALTLTMTLSQNGQEASSETFSLAKAKARSRIALEPAQPLAPGAWQLTLSVSGEGSLTIFGADEASPSLRLTLAERHYAPAPAATGAVLALIALMPAGRRRDT